MARCPRCSFTGITRQRTDALEHGEVFTYRCARCTLQESMAKDEEEFIGWDERWNPPDSEEPEN